MPYPYSWEITQELEELKAKLEQKMAIRLGKLTVSAIDQSMMKTILAEDIPDLKSVKDNT